MREQCATIYPNADEHCACLTLYCGRFESLREPLRERRAALEAQSLLWQFCRDAEEEMAWVQEKLPLVDTQDDGQSLSTLWLLQEKHQVWAHPTNPRRKWHWSRPGARPLGASGHPGFCVRRTRNSLGTSLWDPRRLQA